MRREAIYSILDIDFDYFNLMSVPGDQLRRLLRWADCPVTTVVDRHNHAFSHWRKRWRFDGISPTHILHVDEHHDMMDQRQQTNIGNFMFHAMRMWPECRVHWLVQQAIDSYGCLHVKRAERNYYRFCEGERTEGKAEPKVAR